VWRRYRPGRREYLHPAAGKAMTELSLEEREGLVVLGVEKGLETRFVTATRAAGAAHHRRTAAAAAAAADFC